MKLHMQILIALGLGIKRNGHIFFALIAGFVLGALLHGIKYTPQGEENIIALNIIACLDFVGQAFIRLIQTVVIPLVCSAIIIGLSSIGDSKQLGKFGKKMLLYYSIVTVIAVALGAGLALIGHPGDGVQSFISQTSAVDAQQNVQNSIESQRYNIGAVFINMLPKNPVKALADGDMVPVLVFVMIFGIALAKVGEVSKPLISFFESVFAATMKVTDWIMYLAAPGVFALTAVAVSSFGLTIFDSISKYFLILMLGFAIQLFVVYPLLMKVFSKIPVLTFYSAIAEVMMVAFGTASSSATLPLTLACCEKHGISHKVTSFVIPVGATLNMDATALFQTFAVIFLTQAYGVHLEPLQICLIAFFAIIASSTCAGIPGAGLITIALVLNGLGLTPEQLVEGFAFLFAIDRLLEMFRTMLNVTSDAVIAGIIADNENELNYEMLIPADEKEKI